VLGTYKIMMGKIVLGTYKIMMGKIVLGTYKFMMGKIVLGTYKFMMGKIVLGTYKFMMGTYKMQVMHKFGLVNSAAHVAIYNATARRSVTFSKLTFSNNQLLYQVTLSYNQ
jgi:hypothetical protein